MTREEAIEHARYVRNLSRDASVIALDADVIDAILASPWKEITEDLPKDRIFWINNRAKTVRCHYDGDSKRWMVLDLFSYKYTFNDLQKKFSHWMEIPPVD